MINIQSTELSPEESRHLMQIVTDPVFRRSVEIVCSQLWNSNRDKTNMESAALAWSFADGVCSGFSALNSLAHVKVQPAPTTRRFKMESAIK